MTLEQIRIFLAVAEGLHFTQAAQRLGLTQSAVSAAVAALEARHGLTLFQRIGRRIELTAEGVALLPEARLLLREVRRTEELLDDLSGLERGTLSLMGSRTVAAYWLPPLLHRFHQRYPGITVKMDIGNTMQVATAVMEGSVELGVVEGSVDLPELTHWPVAHDRLALVAGPDFNWISDRTMNAEELARLPWVLREKGSGTRVACETLWASRGLSVNDMTIALELPSNEAVRSAVEAGAGASVLSLFVAGMALRVGTLQAAACDMPSRFFHVLYHHQRRTSHAAGAFLRLLEEAQNSTRKVSSDLPANQ